MTPSRLSLLLLLLLGVSLAPRDAVGAKPKKPKLNVRAVPSMATAPVEVTVFIELKGGDDLEEFYCPEIECQWNDGAKSEQELDCPPFEPGMKLTRHFTLGHLYRRSGAYELRVRLRRAGKTIASGQTTVSVRAGIGEY